jgi:hypothetical protein
MTDATSMEHLPDGLPDTLLENDSKGVPRLFHVLPHPDRSYRRWIARLVRQIFKVDGSDTDVLFGYFSNRHLRQLQFWSAARRMENGTFKHDSFPFSLDLILLQRIDDGDAPAEFDETRFAEACPEWPILKSNIERLTKQTFELVPAKGLRLLMLWPIIQERVSHWKDDELKDWPTFEAIFSLSSITDSPWFLNQAMAFSPDCRNRLKKILHDYDKDAQLAMQELGANDIASVDGPADCSFQTPAFTEAMANMKNVGTDWPTVAARIAEVGIVMGKSPPAAWSERRAEMIAVLEDSLAALKKFDPQEDARSRLKKGIEEFGARLGELDRQPAFHSAISELGTHLSEWQSRTLDLPAHDIVRLGGAIWAALNQLDSQLGALRDAHEKHDAIRQKYLLAQKEAEERNSLTTRRAAAILRAEDSAAEGRLLDAHDSLLQLFAVPSLSDYGAVAKEDEPKSLDLKTDPIPPALNSSKDLEESAAPQPIDSIPTRVTSSADDELIKELRAGISASKELAQEGNPPLQNVTAETTRPTKSTPEVKHARNPNIGSPSDASTATRVETITTSEPVTSVGLVTSQVWDALRKNQTAAAYQLAMLSEAEGLRVADVPPTALLKALSLVNELLVPDGEIALQLSEALSAVDPDSFSQQPDVHASTHLLLMAALLRPLLLAPDSPAPVLVDRIHLPDGCGELYTLLNEFAEATKRMRHYRLSARSFSAVRDEGAWRAEITAVEDRIREWRNRAPQLKIKYQPATAIWREWQKPSGEIDKLFSPIKSNNSSAAELVRVQLDRLTDQRILTEAIQEADRKAYRRGETIHGAALEQFHLRVGEACALAAEWVALFDARPAKGGPRAKDLELARAALARHRVASEKELEFLMQSGSVCLESAAVVARHNLAKAWTLFEPHGLLPTSERGAELVLNRPLLERTECRMRYDWTIRNAPAEIRIALASGLSSEPDLLINFEGRLSRDDIQGATKIAELAGQDDPGVAAQMRARLDPSIKEFWSRVRHDITRLSESIESSLVYGLIGEAKRDGLNEELTALEQQVDDLACADAVQDGIARIQLALDSIEQARRKDLTDALATVRRTADPADFALVEQALAAKDLPSANEYLTRIGLGERLADASERARDPFEELYGSKRVRDIEEFLKGDGRSTNKLIAQLDSGKSIGSLKFGESPESVLRERSRLWTLWFSLKRSNGGSPTPNDPRLKTLQSILTLLGFTNVQIPRGKSGTSDALEAEFECDLINDRNICPVPHFGSHAQGRYRVICVSDRTGIDQLLTRIGPTTNTRPIFAFYFGPFGERQRQELAAATRPQRRSVVVVDEVLLLFLTAERGSRLPALFSCALPFGYVDPYVTTASLVPPEMFFGREGELHQLLDPMGTCFVYGGRQLGKTALLIHAARIFHAPQRSHFAVWIDLKAAHIGLSPETDSSHVWRPIWNQLIELDVLPSDTPEPTPRVKGRVEKFLQMLERWLMENANARLLLLLDEADKFLEGDARQSYSGTAQLKGLMERTGRRFKVVLAGLHNVLRTAAQANHPLGHFGAPIEIGPLISSSEWRQAQKLVRGPLAASGFKFERNGMADRILAQTNFYPSLIQLYCSKLIGRMMEEGRFSSGGPRFTIREQKLDETYLSKDLRDEIRAKFRLTLQLDERYEVIAYAIAHRSYAEQGSRAGTYSAGELAGMARDWWEEGFRRTSDSELRIILEEMVGLGVLRQIDGSERTFTLRNPNLLLLMGTEEEVNEQLVRHRELPVDFTAVEFHSRLSGDGGIAGRHPLTMTQIGSLGSRRNCVAVIAGSKAAGIDRVATALARDHGDAYFSQLEIVVDTRSFTRELKKALGARKDDGTTIVLVPSECPWNHSWIEAAVAELKKLSSKDRGAKVVFIAEPSSQMMEELSAVDSLSEVECVTLRPWTEEFVRIWLEDGHSRDGQTERQTLRKRTGWWPALMDPLSWDGKRAPLEIFVNSNASLRKLVIAMSDYGGAGESRAVVCREEMAELLEWSVEETQGTLRLAQTLALVTPAERGGFRLETGIATLFDNDRIDRA